MSSWLHWKLYAHAGSPFSNGMCWSSGVQVGSPSKSGQVKCAWGTCSDVVSVIDRRQRSGQPAALPRRWASGLRRKRLGCTQRQLLGFLLRTVQRKSHNWSVQLAQCLSQWKLWDAVWQLLPRRSSSYVARSLEAMLLFHCQDRFSFGHDFPSWKSLRFGFVLPCSHYLQQGWRSEGVYGQLREDLSPDHSQRCRLVRCWTFFLALRSQKLLEMKSDPRFNTENELHVALCRTKQRDFLRGLYEDRLKIDRLEDCKVLSQVQLYVSSQEHHKHILPCLVVHSIHKNIWFFFYSWVQLCTQKYHM